MLRRFHRAALAAALLGAAGCQSGSRSPPERFVPADAVAAIVVPEAGRAAKELADLHRTVLGFPGTGEIAAARGALAAQLGFDPLDPEALEDAGLDPRGGAALAVLRRPPGDEAPARPVLVLLPARDAPRLEALFVRIARDRLGATQRSAQAHGAVSVVVLRRPDEPAPALSWAVVGRTAILCAGAAGPAAVAEAAAVAPEASLGAHPGFVAARRALGEGMAAIPWLPPGSPFLEGMWAVKDGLAAGVSAAPGRLVARAAILLGSRAPSFAALAGEGAAAALAAHLDPRAQLVGRWDGDFAALGRKLAPLLPARDRARLAAHGLDLERDLFGQLAPGGAVALSLAPRLDLAGLTGEAARADPLRAVELEALLPVQDPAAAEAISARLAPAGRGARPAPAAGGVHRLQTPSGEIAWVVDPEARRIVAAGGAPGRLEALRARLAGDAGWEAPTDAARAALSGGLGGAVLVVPRVVAAARALPEEAFGTGPSGFVMRSLVDRLLEPASRLAAISVEARLAEGALVLALEVEARAAPEASR